MICFISSKYLNFYPGIASSNHTSQLGQTSPNPVKSNTTIEEENEIADEGWEYENQTVVDTRRILYSKTVGIGKRPYMVSKMVVN